jgi:hypothetical protein
MKYNFKCEYCGLSLKDSYDHPCPNTVANRLIPGHVFYNVSVSDDLSDLSNDAYLPKPEKDKVSKSDVK